MPDRTVKNITDAAYRKNGVKNPSTDQNSNALYDFRDMLSAWSIAGLLVPYYVTENFTLTIGQAVYTIGVTADSPDLETTTGRPVKCVRAWIRQSNYDYPVDVGMSEKEYGEIAKKDTTQRPTRLYYDPQYPNGKLRFNYESDLAHDFYLVSEKALADVTALTDTLSLPLGINEALVYNLAIRLSVDLKSKLKDDVRRIAIESKNALERVNYRNKSQNPALIDSGLTVGVYR